LLAGPLHQVEGLAPGQERTLQVRLIYPADATPPQVLSLLPIEAAAAAASGTARPNDAPAPGAAVKQSPKPPSTAP
jgi:Protein of unknown function (DUF3370)